jgi:hypothetical protein
MNLIKIEDLFDVEYGNQLDLNKLLISKSKSSINFVSRTSKNNGVEEKVNSIKNLEPYSAGLITVTLGGTFLLSAFVQTKPFYTGQNIKVLNPKVQMSLEEKLYYCYLIGLNRFRYTSHGREANKTFNYIKMPDHSFVKEHVKKIHVPNKPTYSSSSKEKILLRDTKWEYFGLNDLFNISASKDKVLLEYKTGKTPYVSSTEFNNGITEYVDSRPTNQSGTLTINRGGSVGEVFFQEFNYIATPVDVRILSKKDGSKFTRAIGLFLSVVISNEKFRFNFSRKMGSDRLKKLKIKLPSKNKLPNWEFMESYIKSLPGSKNIEYN